ncbi:hypothetical protein [Endozoicomonas montiporae]|uniref:Phosphoesterase n=1 Tax=Endozoicomonas montiporae CL-33 TaxID=570277 RepID=A0A142B8J9_9GAMM|nr:hypothetical protein [Endozoicomonas montiporae]AMO55075.1 hypothetical protein EZMO1_0857 [Endozoicomonas montiporae CL-33]
MFRRKVLSSCLASLLAVSVGADADDKDRQWLAGDHHVHTHWSVTFDMDGNFIKGGDAKYSYLKNTTMGKKFGLSWIVNTDHGDPGHSMINFEHAYPELLETREVVDDMVIFYGHEWNIPVHGHATLILPINDLERETMRDFQRQFGRKEAEIESHRNAYMLEGLEWLDRFQEKPLVFLNHPSRSSRELGKFRQITPPRMKGWYDVAPEVQVGMEGAPGHQAAPVRGGYGGAPSIGGMDQMTAVVGGAWDHILGSGRPYWITSNSDFHKHTSNLYPLRNNPNELAPGNDYWPGEYSKTWVYAEKEYSDIMNGLRYGRIFVTFGDLINALDLNLSTARGENGATMGDTLNTGGVEKLHLNIDIGAAMEPNHNGDLPVLNRVDIIVGAIHPDIDLEPDTNSTTKVLKRIYKDEWKIENGRIILDVEIPLEYEKGYVRLRGTNTDTLEPQPFDRNNPDNEWEDLWFYSNPIFWSE